jgi:Holliday junction resolvase RusA-like endonuclease
VSDELDLDLPERRAVEFTVYGVPVPKGSAQAFKDRAGYARVRDSAGSRLTAWSREVAASAREAAEARGGPFRSACRLDVMFRFPMPASRTAAEKIRGVIPRSAKPDADKLIRAIGDACTAGGLVADDALFTAGSWLKVEVHEGWTGAHVEVSLL